MKPYTIYCEETESFIDFDTEVEAFEYVQKEIENDSEVQMEYHYTLFKRLQTWGE